MLWKPGHSLLSPSCFLMNFYQTLAHKHTSMVENPKRIITIDILFFEVAGLMEKQQNRIYWYEFNCGWAKITIIIWKERKNHKSKYRIGRWMWKTLTIVFSVVCCIRKRIQLSKQHRVNLMREFAQQHNVHRQHTLVVIDEQTQKQTAQTHTHAHTHTYVGPTTAIGGEHRNAGTTKRQYRLWNTTIRLKCSLQSIF